MAKGPYGGISDFRSIEEICRDYLKENLSINIDSESAGYDYYDSDSHWSRYRISVKLAGEVITSDTMDVKQ